MKVEVFDPKTEDTDPKTEDTDPATEDTDPATKDDDKKTKDEDGKGKGTANISDSLLASVGTIIDERLSAFSADLYESYGIPKKKAAGGKVAKDSAPISSIRISEFID
jgi:hypothetical protein